jgi:hypothetical protein
MTATTRRAFLKQSAATSAAALVPPVSAAFAAAPASPAMTPGPGNKWPGRVVVNFNKNAVTGTSTAVPSVIQQMIDDSIKRLTGEATVGAAWKAVFPPSLSVQAKIAIKTNTVNSGLPCPHWSSVKQIVSGLMQMEIDGQKYPGTNITIYDMKYGGGFEKTGYTAANFPDVNIAYSRLVDGGDGAMNNKKYASVLKEADFLINVFSPRGHYYPPEGSQFTLCFKSHIGTYASDTGGEGRTFHDNLVQNLRDLNSSGPVYKKTVLAVCSGIFGMNEGHGPEGAADTFYNYAKSMDAGVSSKSASFTTIMMSTDPVSIEMQAIKALRLNKSPAGGYGVNDMPPYLKASAGISGALEGETYNIGIIDETNMDVRRIINGVTSIGEQKSPAHRTVGAPLRLSVSPVPGHSTTFIEFSVTPEQREKEAMIRILTLDGKLIATHCQPVLGIINHYSWDNRTDAGAPVRGPLVAEVTCGNRRITKQFIVHR